MGVRYITALSVKGGEIDWRERERGFRRIRRCNKIQRDSRSQRERREERGRVKSEVRGERR